MRTVCDVLRELGYHPRDCGQFYRVNAFFRNSRDYNISVDKKNGHWVDFARNAKGDLDDLVLLTKGDNVDLNTFMEGVHLVFDTSSQIIMPKIYEPQILDRLFPNYSYWNERGVSDETLKHFKNGLSHSGKMYHRSVFPIFNPDGKIYGFSGRLVVDKDQPKWKHIGKTSQWVYPYFFNKEYIHKEKRVILVESIGDMLALWEVGIRNVLILFSVTIGSGLFKMLIELDYDIDLCLNNDRDKNYVGNIASVKNFAKLSEYFNLERLRIRPPTNNDFGCMNNEEIQTWNKMFFDSFSIIRETLNNQPKITQAEKKLLERMEIYELSRE